MFRISIYIIIALLFSAPPAQAETTYSSAIEDLPLMTGMYELPREILFFDTPQGRIVETAAETKAPEKDVAAFYSAALPALGWEQAQAMVYVRANEKLTLQFEPSHDSTMVRFSLAPKKGK